MPEEAVFGGLLLAVKEDRASLELWIFDTHTFNELVLRALSTVKEYFRHVEGLEECHLAKLIRQLIDKHRVIIGVVCKGVRIVNYKIASLRIPLG